MLQPVSYHISQSDYLEFAKTVQALQIRSFVVFVACLVSFLAVLALYLDDPMLAVGGGAGGVITLIILSIVMRFVVLPSHVSKAYREYALIHEEMTLAFTETDFSISQKSGSVTLKWADVVLWNENDQIIAVHPTRQLGYIFPKSQIGEDHAEFIRRRLAMSGLPDKAKVRS